MTTENDENCYMCNGTGLLESDEECACFSNACRCFNCVESRMPAGS